MDSIDILGRNILTLNCSHLETASTLFGSRTIRLLRMGKKGPETLHFLPEKNSNYLRLLFISRDYLLCS